MVELDLRNISVTSMELINNHIENELEGKLYFSADEELHYNIIEITESGKECDITYRVKRSSDEITVEEIVTKKCLITGFSDIEDVFDDGFYHMELDFVTSNAGIRILSVLKSKDGKEIVVAPEIVKLVNKNCKPKDITFDNLQKVVLACEI